MKEIVSTESVRKQKKLRQRQQLLKHSPRLACRASGRNRNQLKKVTGNVKRTETSLQQLG